MLLVAYHFDVPFYSIAACLKYPICFPVNVLMTRGCLVVQSYGVLSTVLVRMTLPVFIRSALFIVFH